MYTSFSVKNFRCFDDLTLDNLARVNLIAGKNNVGKTALLEALLLHSGRYDAGLMLRTQAITNVRPYGVRSRVRSLPDWNTIFYALDTSRIIKLEGKYIYHITQQDYQQTLFPPPEQWFVEIELLDNLNNLTNGSNLRRLLAGLRDFELAAQNISVLQIKSDDKDNGIHYMLQYEGAVYSDIRCKRQDFI